jgi:pilus assembly protein CpaF
VLAQKGIALGTDNTFADIGLPDHSRFVGIIPPTAPSGPCIVIRKFFKASLTFEKLFEFNALTPAMHASLRTAVQKRRHLLVTGDTGSGKTTFLNMLTSEIPADERVVVVEEFLEYQPQAKRVVRLVADQMASATFTEVINLAMRTRPDRLVFGELHGAETLRILQVLSMGYDGSFLNMHAISPEDALARMEAYCLTANAGLGLSEIRSLIASTVPVIAFLQRLPSGVRRVKQVVEVCGLEDDRYLLQPLYRYNPETDAFDSMDVKPSWEK